VSLSVAAPFGWRCLTSRRMPRTPAPPHRTGRAVLPHPALRSPSAAGMHSGQPARHGGIAATGAHAPTTGVSASRQSPWARTVSGAVKVRPLPSAEVVLSSTCERYYGPLRLPGQPGGDFSGRLIRPGRTPVVHWPGSPVVPAGAVPACHPCYPGGPPMPWQRWWASAHRSSSPDNGVDALAELTRLPLGSLHAIRLRRTGLRTSVPTRSSGNSALPVTRGASLELPGRAARSRGRTSTGEFQRIHGILSGTICVPGGGLLLREHLRIPALYQCLSPN
jgi:hypothetical protein